MPCTGDYCSSIEYCLQRFLMAVFWETIISLTNLDINTEVPLSDIKSRQKSSNTSISKAVAIFATVSGDGHLLPLSMSLRKGMEIPALKASSSCDTALVSLSRLIFCARICLTSFPSILLILLVNLI